MGKKKLVISTGAGMSAESRINTFRDAGGLWENYNVGYGCKVSILRKHWAAMAPSSGKMEN